MPDLHDDDLTKLESIFRATETDPLGHIAEQLAARLLDNPCEAETLLSALFAAVRGQPDPAEFLRVRKDAAWLLDALCGVCAQEHGR